MSENTQESLADVGAAEGTARPWLPFGEPCLSAPRLYCFPSAGSSAAGFAPWRRLAPPGVLVCPVQPPGRAERFRETPYDRCDTLVDELATALRGQFTGTYALYGHSLGALVAFELARHLRSTGAPPPVHLFVSGRPAPHLPSFRRTLYALPAADLIGEVARMGGTPEEILRTDDVMELLLPLLRADLAVNETYEYREQPPLGIPLTVFGGKRDPRADEAEILAWERLTSARFQARMFPGGHFFINDRTEELMEIMARSLLG
ncbi:alpha/beta fold hydrolase [Streptomyces sp. NPDC052052]|uniref:thioesterase II family protein n=1 Tax=Streptomyces sp. NPDC052052 TaxID=3154756 RepID=UPI00342221BD